MVNFFYSSSIYEEHYIAFSNFLTKRKKIIIEKKNLMAINGLKE